MLSSFLKAPEVVIGMIFAINAHAGDNGHLLRVLRQPNILGNFHG